MLVGTFLVLFIFVKYGLPFLANMSLFISGFKNQKEETKKNTAVYVQPPLLDPIVSGTNSAQLKISGTSTPKQTINLYLNDSLEDKTTVGSDSTFSFEDVTLKSGENTIKTKAVTPDNKESDFSDVFTIVYKNSAPSLSVDSPKDGQTFNKDDDTANITGKTDPGVEISINNLRAIVDISGTFSYNLPLKNGENKITVEAIDESGNKTKKELKVTYNQ